MTSFSAESMSLFMPLLSSELRGRLFSGIGKMVKHPSCAAIRGLEFRRVLFGHDAQLLIACDIDTPEAMLRHSPQELLAKVTPIAKSKEGQRILRSSPAPDLDEINDWLAWAKQHRLLQVA